MVPIQLARIIDYYKIHLKNHYCEIQNLVKIQYCTFYTINVKNY